MAHKLDIEAKEAKNSKILKKPIKTEGPKKYVDPSVKKYIKNHAKTSSQEIYGWLIGKETKSGEIFVFSALACERYVKQNYIGAAPDPREIQELSTNIPEGLAMVGIYHSHPADIFHSSIDDKTLQNLAKMYPNVLSAVTNADEFDDPSKNETRWFQLDENQKETVEIEVNYKSIPLENFTIITVYGELNIDLNVPLKGKIVQQIVRKVSNQYEDIWKNSILEIFRLKKKELKKINEWSLDFLPYQIMNIRKSADDKINLNSINENLIESLEDNNEVKFITLTYIDEKISENENSIRIKGKIPMVVFNLFEGDDKEKFNLNNILQSIQTGFQEDFIQKISRGILDLQFEENGVNDERTPFFLLHCSTSINLPYFGIPLKFNIITEDINKLEKSVNDSLEKGSKIIEGLEKSSLHAPSQFIELEDEILNSLSKRAYVLARSGKSENALSILNIIKNIYLARGQLDKIQKIDNMINLLNSL